MTYAFVFTGEFGYELFNWQGVVRKWVSENKKPQDKIIICSRAGLNNIYDFADRYINISQVESYNNTVADCYRGYVWEEKKDLDFDDWPIIGSGPKYDKLVQQIENDIKNIVEECFGLDLDVNSRELKYIEASTLEDAANKAVKALGDK